MLRPWRARGERARQAFDRRCIPARCVASPSNMARYSRSVAPRRSRCSPGLSPRSVRPACLKHVVYSHRGYLIPRSNGAIIAGSTTENADFDKSVTAGGIASIIAAAIETMPMANDMTIVETWAGLRPGTADGLPVIGEDPQISGLYYATGHYRNGILLSPITAEAIAQLILKGSAQVDLSPFSITRFADRAAFG